jgi:hypothetical protein
MVNLWKTLRKPMWICRGAAVENPVEKRVCINFCSLCCEKPLGLAKKILLFVNNNWLFGGKLEQRRLVGVSTVSTVST